MKSRPTAARAEGRAIVALESTIITHGMPFPQNVETARAVEAEVRQIIAEGFDASTVDRIIGLVDRAEWKRRQGAIGPKITGMAFGRDRRLPITNKFK